MFTMSSSKQDGSYFSLGYYDYFTTSFLQLIRQRPSENLHRTELYWSIQCLRCIQFQIQLLLPDSGIKDIRISGFPLTGVRLCSQDSTIRMLLHYGKKVTWLRVFRMDFVRQTSDGGFAILSTVDGVLRNQHDIQLMKVNANGDSLWSKTTVHIWMNEHCILKKHQTADL